MLRGHEGLLLRVGPEFRIMRVWVVIRHGTLVGGGASVHLVVVVPVWGLGEAYAAAAARVVLKRGVAVALRRGGVGVGARLVALLLSGVPRV